MRLFIVGSLPAAPPELFFRGSCAWQLCRSPERPLPHTHTHTPAAAVAAGAAAWDVARTPPMGFNTVSSLKEARRHACRQARRCRSPLFTGARGGGAGFSLSRALGASLHLHLQWNLYHCGTSAAVLNNTAASLVASGLAKAGFTYVSPRARRRRRRRIHSARAVRRPGRPRCCCHPLPPPLSCR